ncbi:DUF982 domain-containing protein [Mesorhizobium sp. CAU 1732]|uniref:DUF982 domain-containing protein n=1 Tax=Mesorhizobium sp. CAU 1732 TaxID=3140358 RepID=UPI003260342E
MDQQFEKPVRIALGRYGAVAHIVTSPRQAAEKLLMEWPTEPGKRHLAARKAVLEAMENARDGALVAKARKAFEAAAAEAGILMPEMVRPTGGKSVKWGKRKR